MTEQYITGCVSSAPTLDAVDTPLNRSNSCSVRITVISAQALKYPLPVPPRERNERGSRKLTKRLPLPRLWLLCLRTLGLEYILCHCGGVGYPFWWPQWDCRVCVLLLVCRRWTGKCYEHADVSGIGVLMIVLRCLFRRSSKLERNVRDLAESTGSTIMFDMNGTMPSRNRHYKPTHWVVRYQSDIGSPDGHCIPTCHLLPRLLCVTHLGFHRIPTEASVGRYHCR